MAHYKGKKKLTVTKRAFEQCPLTGAALQTKGKSAIANKKKEKPSVEDCLPFHRSLHA